MRNGLFLCLICLVLQSCITTATYSVLPKNIHNHSEIEGIYSNISEIDTLTHKAYRTETIWNIFDRKNEIKSDSIIVKIEIVNSKSLKFSFFKAGENIGTKLLKGGLARDECFYTLRRFYFVPILPLLWWYEDSQERIYRIDNELIIETIYSGGGVCIIMAGGNDYNRIWKFKRIENE